MCCALSALYPHITVVTIYISTIQVLPRQYARDKYVHSQRLGSARNLHVKIKLTRKML